MQSAQEIVDLEDGVCHLSDIAELSIHEQLEALKAELRETKEKLRLAEQTVERLERLYTTTHRYTVELKQRLQLVTDQLDAQRAAAQNQTSTCQLSATLDAAVQHEKFNASVEGWNED